MFHLIRVFLIAAFLCHAQAQTALPKSDPFYAIPSPSSLNSYAQGHILEYRLQPNVPSAFAPDAHPQAAYAVKYVTRNAQGEKTAAVTTVIVPRHPVNRILSYQPAYDSSNLDCSPSYQFGAPGNLYNLTQGFNIETKVMALALNKGWYVVAPDYEGLTAAFSSGLTSGQATLDGITAALNSGAASGFTSISPRSQVGILGYSGGAIATEWAAELQNRYAPSLSRNIVGIAAGGIVANVTDALVRVNENRNVSGGAEVFLIPNGFQGIASTFPEFAKYLRDSLEPSSVAAFNHSLNTCNNQSYYNGQDIFATYFRPGITLHSFVNGAEFQKTVQTSGLMGVHGYPTRPTYLFQGAQDELASASLVNALVDKYCTHGDEISLEYVLNPFTTHTGELLAGLGGALQFLQDRFLGLPSVKGCAKFAIERNSSVNLLP